MLKLYKLLYLLLFFSMLNLQASNKIFEADTKELEYMEALKTVKELQEGKYEYLSEIEKEVNVIFSNQLIVNQEANEQLTKFLTLSKEIKKDKILTTINKFMEKFFPETNEKFVKHIVVAIMKVESDFNHKALGDLNTNSPAVGIMQVRISTAQYMNKTIPYFKKKYGNKSKEWLKLHLTTLEGGIEYGMGYLFFKKKYIKFEKIDNKSKFFTMVSLYNGGFLNHHYVNKVFNEIDFMEQL